MKGKSIGLADGIAAGLRWFTLLSLAVSLLANQAEILTVEIALLAAALWSLLISISGVFINNAQSYALLSVAGDTIVAGLLFAVGLDSYTGIGWIGLLPVISAAIYFQFAGVMLASLAMALIQFGTLAFFTSVEEALIFCGLLLVVYILVGMVMAYPARKIRKGLPLSKERSAPAELKVSEREQRRGLYNMFAALSATLNYQRVLETALDMTSGALGISGTPADRLVSAVLLFEERDGHTRLGVGCGRRFSQTDMRSALPGTQGLIGQVIDEGIACLTKAIGKDPELKQLISLQNCHSAYCVPLRMGLDNWGVLLFAHPDAEFFNPDIQEVLGLIGNQVTIAIQNARLYRDLEQEKERMIEVQEEARKKMARDLHDGPTQSVSAIAMRVNFARRLMERDPKSAADELFKIEDLARRTTKEIRHMLFTLRPLVLESQGLVAALESMADKMRETYNQNVIIQADPRIVSELETGKQAVVFYIAEEAVNNARKHARAAHIYVRLVAIKEDLGLLEIEDDGAGFNVRAVDSSYENRGSLGMVNMRERSELLNGVFYIDAAEGRGTRIRVLIPLNEQAADRIRRGG